MERIGTQVRLPIATAVRISLQGIRIRLARALITLSGVVLGIAFLTSVMTGELVKSAVSREQSQAQTVAFMDTMVRSEIGSYAGKRVAVVVVGSASAAEQELIRKILKAKPAEVRGHGVPLTSERLSSSDLKGIGRGASILLVLGDGQDCLASVADLTEGMAQPAMLDSLSSRRFGGESTDSATRGLFFGKEAAAARSEQMAKEAQEKVRTVWILSISLVVTVICISNALLMSVTERFKEIGTMKCLGALSGFIRQLFVVESAIIGVSGSVVGIVLGASFPIVAYGFTYGFGAVFGSMNYGQLALYGFACLIAGTLLSMLAAIYPANIAARMVPAMALRSNV